MLDNVHEANDLGNNAFVGKMIPAVVLPAGHEIQSQKEPSLLPGSLSGRLSG